MLITACNSRFSATDSACACKKYELLMHVLANAVTKAILIIFVLFEDSIYILYYTEDITIPQVFLIYLAPDVYVKRL